MNTQIESSQNTGVEASARQRAGRRRVWPWFLLMVAVVVAIIVWRHPWRSGMPGGPMGLPPGAGMQSVAVAQAAKGDIPITLTSLGTVTSLATVTIKSQISGYLTEIHFREGQTVKKGDLLAQIDPRTYEASLAQYEGQLEKDQAQLDNARLDLKRYQQLIQQNSTSRQTLDTAAANVRQYEGTVRTDRAQIDTQKLNLTYCRIVSPIDGRVGLRQVDAGNYVTASDTGGIVVVTQTAPISVVFTLPEDSLRQVLKRLRAGAALGVTAWDRTHTEKLAEGTLDSVDNQVDTSTGTVKLRAQFTNEGGALFPNQFVNVSMLVETLQGVVTVPSAAIQTGSPGTFVYLANSDNTVSLRKIVTGASANGQVAVLSGLAEGDRVVVDGADHLSDGAAILIPASEKGEAAAAVAPNTHR
ncbi:MAG: MdtA/MuxA family multidrug efflux RND transporter periplasmic adaptor subunit [Chthoniobacteraceae bacterium]